MRIHKYSFGRVPFHTSTITVPEVFKYLDLQLQDGKLCIWAIVDTDSEINREITLEMYITGQEIQNTVGLIYSKTIQDGLYVAHIFERRK